VLRDVTFTLEAGSFTFLTGASGAGKSTLLRLMFLANPPDARADHAVRSRSRDGVAFDVSGLQAADRRRVPGFSAARSPLGLRQCGSCRSGSRAETGRLRAHDVEELLGWVGLGDRLNAKPPTLSGGEQQRVAIARAVVGRPDLLVADEPTGNVDAEIGQRLIRLFGELNRLGTTVLIATHDRSLIEQGRAREMRLVDGDWWN
jgi:cell division transport system ATP-binding protein